MSDRSRMISPDFLRLCLCARWDQRALAVAKALGSQPEPEWREFIASGEGARLAPLLYLGLRGQSVVPPSVEGLLRAGYEENALRNAIWLYELESLLARLASLDIRVILLKGAALAESVYGNAAARPMTDLDLLIRRADLPAAEQALAQAGYGPPSPGVRAGRLPVYENERVLCRPGINLPPVELHCSLIDSPFYQERIQIDWFWQTARPAQVGNRPALVLGWEAELLYLCAHLVLHHQGEGILWLHDMAALVFAANGRLDWEELLARAQSNYLVSPLKQVMPRLAADWSVPIPADILTRLATTSVTGAEASVVRRLTRPVRPVGRRFLDDLVTLPNWHKRLTYAWHHLLPSPSYMRHHYTIVHPLLVPFYYPYRWFLGLRNVR